jgi:hypothetical protein
MDQCDVILRAGLESAREEFVKATAAGTLDPVVVLCPVDVYRALRPDEEDHGAGAVQLIADQAGLGPVAVIVERHPHLYEGLQTISPGAAEALGRVPDPERPFRVVVITRGGSKVVSPPAPAECATFGRRIFRSCRERAEVEYLKAVRRIVLEPVVMIDARGQSERRRKLEDADGGGDDAGLPKVHVSITVGGRATIAQELKAISSQAAEDVARGANPDRPFTVVVVTAGRVEIFDNPEPS